MRASSRLALLGQAYRLNGNRLNLLPPFLGTFNFCIIAPLRGLPGSSGPPR
jgi:hypothetical protein